MIMTDEQECSKCQKFFSTKDLLAEHLKREHSDYETPRNQRFLPTSKFFDRDILKGFIVGALLTCILIAGYSGLQGFSSTVEITVIGCDNCSYGEFRNSTDSILESPVYREIDYRSKEASDLINRFDVDYVPAFVFSEEVERSENFTRISAVMNKVGDSYVLHRSPAERYSEGFRLE